jgi:hypothetical protein
LCLKNSVFLLGGNIDAEEGGSNASGAIRLTPIDALWLRVTDRELGVTDLQGHKVKSSKQMPHRASIGASRIASHEW